jgi:serine/threonine protein kinase
MHDEKSIVHMDVKATNVLLDRKMNIVLVDFGFATCRDIDKLKCYIGTRPYMAPEVIL